MTEALRGLIANQDSVGKRLAEEKRAALSGSVDPDLADDRIAVLERRLQSVATQIERYCAVSRQAPL
jgi:hypothetical protein